MDESAYAKAAWFTEREKCRKTWQIMFTIHIALHKRRVKNEDCFDTTVKQENFNRFHVYSSILFLSFRKISPNNKLKRVTHNNNREKGLRTRKEMAHWLKIQAQDFLPFIFIFYFANWFFSIHSVLTATRENSTTPTEMRLDGKPQYRQPPTTRNLHKKT